MRDDMLDRVEALIREVAQTIVLPRWRHLGTGEVHQKGPGDLVTIADQESERALTAGLKALLPGSTVVGEEAVAADPDVLRRTGDAGAVWIVDPVDGTNNFAAGKTPFAVMVALLQDGEQVGAWILDVVSDRMVRAEAGSGAFADGVRMKTRADAPAAAALTGTVSHNHFPEDLRDRVAAGATKFAGVSAGHHCAGYEYPAVALDEQQFAVFWRILPWDHAPGSLIVREAGGTVLRLDGSRYSPAEDGPGLLVAPNDDIWHTVRGTLLS
ncbi:inositol monophosphatase family protein [Actinoplanes sp. RD1]|uniref:inositol monophosphatase family protein n=1 Tax=Actinoplanes sp. RD1 TaxID=3064538 RepID=UPI002740FA80|nr:inositol monophosphatase family protein [Actinoplanes sp. RD1]